jgi:hypothetical protein
LLDELLSRGEVEISELGQAGIVSTIRVLNRSDHDALILDGTELHGAKQNRMVNVTIVAGASDTTDIPVTCVEAKRWGYRGHRFASAGRTVNGRLRRAKSFDVNATLAARGVAATDQHAVWDRVSCCLHRAGVRSFTDALDDAFASRQADVDLLVERLRGLEAHGVAVAVGGELTALDLFDHRDTFRKLWESLLRGHVMDAILDNAAGASQIAREDVERLLDEIRAGAQLRSCDVPGVAQYWTIDACGVGGAAVVHRDTVVHVAVFTAPQEDARG